MPTKNFPKKLAVKKPIIIRDNIATIRPVPGILKVNRYLDYMLLALDLLHFYL